MQDVDPFRRDFLLVPVQHEDPVQSLSTPYAGLAIVEHPGCLKSRRILLLQPTSMLTVMKSLFTTQALQSYRYAECSCLQISVQSLYVRHSVSVCLHWRRLAYSYTQGLRVHVLAINYIITSRRYPVQAAMLIAHICKTANLCC